MGLPRPSEQFPRVYSAPDPPAPARRPKLLALLVALVTFAVAAVVVFLVVPLGSGGGDHAGERSTPGTAPTDDPAAPAPTGPGTPSPERTAPTAGPIASLPAPCSTIPAGTVQQILPGAKREESANSTLTTCTYYGTGSGFRWLRVEAHLYPPGATSEPVKDAEGYYDAQWAQAHQATLERTITLERQPGIGDEAYRWFKADKGQPTVVGQVTARVRNAVFTVSYSEQAAGKGEQDKRERTCMAKAVRVAREVLAALR
ncbi:hypothetical protein [Actinomadura fibrosa]|uniref:DUF3558 domain-containing protein n=1 Tax=Actinomadura fibrosa TaxID=111802 RepID=A0ABW2XP64_9ACTN|nr:hypothetical protein [Actinomadura fibrosa]